MKNDLALRTAFEAKKKIDKDFAKDGKAQLDWVYENSPYYEKKLIGSIRFTGYCNDCFIKWISVVFENFRINRGFKFIRNCVFESDAHFCFKIAFKIRHTENYHILFLKE